MAALAVDYDFFESQRLIDFEVVRWLRRGLVCEREILIPVFFFFEVLNSLVDY